MTAMAHADQTRARSLRDYDLKHARNDAEISLRTGGDFGMTVRLTDGSEMAGR